jgi:predicted nucleic acid-binding protein
MILADTTIWIDHIRAEDSTMHKMLDSRQIAMHPFVVGELALGPLRNRLNTLADLDLLPPIPAALNGEVRRMIEDLNLHNRGIGWTDAHLIAAVLIDPSTRLWTRDKTLRSIAESLAIHVAWK